ncbi:hypothetical protein SUGI_0219880 [Cryptomeria japonica]|uniref:uncharacterized protein LOC131043895 isoform X2 n=1 Tax=Cryptomeria japonica TaxID=3369 RepID=UPI002408BCB5|nr:uncharacterized protein LOC131043895 isoform X2 [Cryptomeria japonica]XP_057833111.1 uncharacterized protein LOC131043895 isoform X2 [Cryptomeria japonica]GLJ13772.1 hypothetical protein SUGI_0219880 [Cryptomeria japonica]
MASPEIINVSDDSIDSTISIRNSEIENGINPLMQSYCGVPAGSRGEGLPYAPQGWPNPEDKWGWQVGKRTNLNGSWRDRYLILPKSVSEGRRAIRFQSKLEVIKYLTETFPGLDLEKFFASFQWLVPAYFPDQMPTKSNNEEEVASGNPNFSNTIAVDREKGRIVPDLRCLPADRRALTVEKEVNQALHMLRRLQEREYIAARDKLLAQKDLLVTFLQPTNGSLSSSALEKAYEKELERFRNMLVIAKGFGNTSREFLQHRFPKGPDGYQPDAYSDQVIRLGWIDTKSEFPNPNEEVTDATNINKTSMEALRR